MNPKIKDFFKSFSPLHETSDQDMLPSSLESVVKEPSNPSDVSDIFTTNYKPAAEIKTAKSIIQKDMVVHGSIESKSDIEIAGTINGDITSEGRVTVLGCACGNISGKSVSVHAKELNANITAVEKVNLDKEVILNGDISAKSVIINGTVNGNISASVELIVMASAAITGDIEAPSMEVNRGAVINGKVTFTTKG